MAKKQEWQKTLKRLITRADKLNSLLANIEFDTADLVDELLELEFDINDHITVLKTTQKTTKKEKK